MYRIDTHQARTDLYGIGKGAAQVWNPELFLMGAKLRQGANEEAQAKKEKLAAQRGEDVTARLQALGKDAVMPRDLAMFDQKKSDLYQKVKDNWSKIEAGDEGAILDVNQSINQLMTEAELSKNTREYAETVGKALALSPGKYRPESLKYYADFTTNPQNAGNYNLDMTQIKQNIDIGAELNKLVLPVAKQRAIDNAITKTFSADQSKDEIRRRISSNPLLMDQAQYDFDNDTEKYGASNPVDYAVNKYYDDFVIDQKHPAYFTGFGNGPGQNKKTVESVLTYHSPNDWDMSLEYKDKTNVRPKAVKDPSDPSKTIDVIPQKVVKKGNETYMEAFTVAGRDPVSGMPIRGNTIKLGFNDAQRIAKEDFGVDNVYDVAVNRNIPEHMELKPVDLSGTKTATAKPGSKIFNSLSQQEKINLKAQSGAKTQQEFVTWLKNNGYK